MDNADSLASAADALALTAFASSLSPPPAAAVRFRTQQLTQLSCSGLSVVLINDLQGRYVPLVNAKLEQAKAMLKEKDGVWAVDAGVDAESNFFNHRTTTWEPLIEPTSLRFMVFQVPRGSER